MWFWEISFYSEGRNTKWRPDQQEETKGWNGRFRDFYTGNDYIQDSADRSVNGHSKKIYVFVYVVFYICLELHCMISILLVIIYYSFYTYVFVLIKKNIAIFTKRLLMSLMIQLNLITKKDHNLQWPTFPLLLRIPQEIISTSLFPRSSPVWKVSRLDHLGSPQIRIHSSHWDYKKVTTIDLKQ